ncbi:hypothetical protein KJA15_01090 [Patescibacteria group bacterium]|nr:hypothetical protein [Patescibacteria group bacterium]
MGEIIAEWLKKWLKKHQRHRTVNKGSTLVCPKNMITIDVTNITHFKYCPLCGTDLGKIKIEGEHNHSWEH